MELKRNGEGIEVARLPAAGTTLHQPNKETIRATLADGATHTFVMVKDYEEGAFYVAHVITQPNLIDDR